MQYSVTYPLVAHPYDPELITKDGLGEFCRTAEEAGFNGIGLTDHPAPTARWLHGGGHDALDPFVALSFCAAMTEGLRLIPNIAVLPYRHPLVVAKMVSTLDALSGGRFIHAVATGYLRGEYRALGVDFEQRNLLFDQAVDILRRVWSEDPFSYEGKGISASSLAVNPKPSTLPPIWIGGNSQLSRRRVARYGDGWTPFPAPRALSQTAKTPALETIEDLATMLDELWCYVDEVGRDRAEIDVSFGTPAGGDPGDDQFDALLHAEGLEELEELGVTWAQVAVPGDSLEHALETLRRYGEGVITPKRHAAD